MRPREPLWRLLPPACRKALAGSQLGLPLYLAAGFRLHAQQLALAGLLPGSRGFHGLAYGPRCGIRGRWVTPAHVHHPWWTRYDGAHSYHLEGYRQSQPVRIGNGAYTQQQLDVYGEGMDALSISNHYNAI